jgi:hypothetical protein
MRPPRSQIREHPFRQARKRQVGRFWVHKRIRGQNEPLADFLRDYLLLSTRDAEG